MSIISITSVRTLDDIEALLDRLDPAVDAFCAVPGCVHHAAREHSDATWVGARWQRPNVSRRTTSSMPRSLRPEVPRSPC